MTPRKAKKRKAVKEIHRGDCLQCPSTEDVLDMNTVLYHGFGGYEVRKNGQLWYRAETDEPWENIKTLAGIEAEAKQDPTADWVIILDNPLRGARWQRTRGDWVLTETNKGFA